MTREEKLDAVRAALYKAARLFNLDAETLAAAVRHLFPQPSADAIRAQIEELRAKLSAAEQQIEGMRADAAERVASLRAAEAECSEQARLNGMGSEREARLLARVAEVERQKDVLQQSYVRAQEAASAQYEARLREVEQRRDTLIESLKGATDDLNRYGSIVLGVRRALGIPDGEAANEICAVETLRSRAKRLEEALQQFVDRAKATIHAWCEPTRMFEMFGEQDDPLRREARIAREHTREACAKDLESIIEDIRGILKE